MARPEHAVMPKALALIVAVAFLLPANAALANDDLQAYPRLTLMWQDAAAPEADVYRTLYPSFGLTLQHPVVEVDFETMMPIVLIDGIVAIFRFLGGNDDGLPLFNALNSRDPGATPLWSAAVRFNVKRHDIMRVAVGLGTDLQLLSFDVDGYEDGVGALGGNIGPLASLRLEPDDRFSLRITGEVGNGFIAQSAWNPYVGGEVAPRLMVTDVFGFYASGWYRMQRWDFRGEDDTSGLADPPYVDTFHFWEVHGGITVNFAAR